MIISQQSAMILIGEKVRLIQQLLQECEVVSSENHLSFKVIHPNLDRFTDIDVVASFPQDQVWDNDTQELYSECESDVNYHWCSSSEHC